MPKRTLPLTSALGGTTRSSSGRKQRDRRARFEPSLRLGSQSQGVPDGKYRVESLVGGHTQHRLHARRRIIGRPHIDHRDAQDGRRPGLHEGKVAHAAEEVGEPRQQLIPVELGTAPAVNLRQDVDRILDQASEPVEPKHAAGVRRGGRGCRVNANLDNAEQR